MPPQVLWALNVQISFLLLREITAHLLQLIVSWHPFYLLVWGITEPQEFWQGIRPNSTQLEMFPASLAARVWPHECELKRMFNTQVTSFFFFFRSCHLNGCCFSNRSFPFLKAGRQAWWCWDRFSQRDEDKNLRDDRTTRQKKPSPGWPWE